MQTTTPTAKRALALALMLAMLLTVLPTAALADTIGGEGEQVESSEGTPSDAGGLPPGTFDPEDPEDNMSENTGETPAPEGDTGDGDNPGEPPADTPPVAPASAPPVTLNTPLSAEETIDIEAPGTGGTGWDYNSGVVTILTSGNYRIEGTGTQTNNRVVVGDNLTVTVTLNNVDIAGQDAPAFDIEAGATVNLWLEGSTTLNTNSIDSATLHVPETATLVINSTDDGSLTASTSGFGAAIGGGDGSNPAGSGNCGTIAIKGGTVEATTSGRGAAIGGSSGGNGGTVTIEGGTVNATTSSSGAAIGGGWDGTGSTIIIEGGTVNATTSGTGAAIGGGENGNGGTITIQGDAHVTATAESRSSGAAIGGGNGGNGGAIAISGNAHVTASTANRGAAIGGGSVGNGGTVTIEGGTVEATTSSYGAAIGGGDAGNGGTIKIKGNAKVTATAELLSNGAAIGGGGDQGDGGTIIIEDNAQVTASTAYWGAAIGGGHRGNGADVTIAGGTVEATTSGSGAAIGGGWYGNGAAVTIEGNAQVTATAESGSNGAAIGGGRRGNGGGVTIAGGHTTATYIGKGNDSTGSTGTVTITGGSLVIAETSGDRAPGGSMSATFTDGMNNVYPLPVEVSCDSAPVDKLPLSVGAYEADTDGDGKATIWLSPDDYTLEQGDTNLLPNRADITVGATNDNPVFRWTLYGPIVFTDSTLPTATVGQSYSYHFASLTTGGKVPYTYTLEAGSTLPDGTTFTNGELTGTPTETGDFPFTVKVEDDLGQTQTAAFTLRVSDAPPVTFAITVTGGRATVGAGAVTEAQQGVTVTITADAAPAGQVFDKWVVGSGNPADLDVTANPATFTMPGEAVRITATYKTEGGGTNTYTVHIQSGTATVGGQPISNAQQGVTVTITADAAPAGQVFDKWVVGSGNPADLDVTANPATFTMPGEAVQITATYKTEGGGTNTYTVHIQSGTATVGGQPISNAQQGVTVTITADAAPAGQVFDKWVVNSGNPSDLDVTANPATFTMPGGAVRITATYRADSSGNGGGTRPPISSGGSTWTPLTVTFTGVPTGAIEVGKSFTVIPSYDDRTGSAGWTWDSDMFTATFNSPATFTALKEGTSTITYTTLDGVKSSFTVTVGAATAATDPAAPAPEGTGSADDDEKANPGTGVGAYLPVVKGGVRAAKRTIHL